MKTYLLNSVEDKKPIGEILYDEANKTLEIKVYDDYKQKFSKIFERAVEGVIKEGEFGSSKTSNTSFSGVNNLFLQAIFEKCIKILDIYPELN